MKHLETLKTQPHEDFYDITDDHLYNYAKDTFDLHLKSLTMFKDIINIYSFILYGENPKKAFKNKKEGFLLRSYIFTLPDNGDILNAALSSMIKIKTNERSFSKTYLTGTEQNNSIPMDEHIFIKDLLRLELTEEIVEEVHGKMTRVIDFLKVPKHHYVEKDFLAKVLKKKYTITKFRKITINAGYIYIDFSMSVLHKNLYLFKIFRDSLPFDGIKKIKIHVYGVTSVGIAYINTVTSKEEFISLLSAQEFKAGEINIDSVEEHISKHKVRTTFVTDAEDFDGSTFKGKINNCNIVMINETGHITTT